MYVDVCRINLIFWVDCESQFAITSAQIMCVHLNLDRHLCIRFNPAQFSSVKFDSIRFHFALCVHIITLLDGIKRDCMCINTTL